MNFKNSECLVTNENGKVLMRGIKTKEKCYEWVPHLEDKNVQQTRMLQTMMKHQLNSEVLDLSQCGSIDDCRRISRMGSFLINDQIWSQHYSSNLMGKEWVFTEDRFVSTFRRMFDMKPFENMKDKLGISQIEKLQQLLHDRRAIPFCVSLLSLVHVN